MTVEPDSEQHQIDSRANQGVVTRAVPREVSVLWIEKMKRGRRQIHVVEQLLLQCVSRASRVIRTEAAEFVQHEHARACERDEAGGGAARHLRIDAGWRRA